MLYLMSSEISVGEEIGLEWTRWSTSLRRLYNMGYLTDAAAKW